MTEAPRSRVRFLLGTLLVVTLGSFLLRHFAPAPAPAPPPPPPPVLEGELIRLELAWRLGTLVVDLVPAADDSGRLFALEQRGVVRAIDGSGVGAEPWLDIRDRVIAGGERGLLGLAFAPDFAASGVLYVNYTAQPDGRTVVSRFTLRPGAEAVSADTEQLVLEIGQPYANHNAGGLQFGPDGMLWIATGDGGAGGDPQDRAENPDELLGKMLRIDVDPSAPHGAGGAYGIPAGNAFDGVNGRAEIWAIGLRNPWRYDFDSATGDLWIADVGQNTWEEVNFVPAGTGAGLHFGWDTLEGSHCFEPSEGCDAEGKVLPVYEYSHDDGCSVTGGFVYRGSRMPSLEGAYLFADFCSGWIRALRPVAPDDSGAGSGAEPPETSFVAETLFARTGMNIVAFGEDAEGEPYVVDHNGGVYRMLAR